MPDSIRLSLLGISDVFSFTKKGAVHMVTRVCLTHIEYKSYNGGKIRVAHLERERDVYLRPAYDKYFDLKWFKCLD